MYWDELQLFDSFFSLIKIVQIKSGFNNNMNINNKAVIQRSKNDWENM